MWGVDVVFTGTFDNDAVLDKDDAWLCESGSRSLGLTDLFGDLKHFRIPRMKKSRPSSKNSRMVRTEKPRKRPRIPPISDTKLTGCRVKCHLSNKHNLTHK